MLVWTQNPGLPPADLQQIALLLTGTARAVAADVRRAADRLPEDHAARALADVVLKEASRRLSVPPEGTARCAQNRARLVRALYERLDRLVAVAPQAATAAPAHRRAAEPVSAARRDSGGLRRQRRSEPAQPLLTLVRDAPAGTAVRLTASVSIE